GSPRGRGDEEAERAETAERTPVFAEEVVGQFESWAQALRSRSRANLIVHSLETPLAARLGVLDSQLEDGQTAAILRVNRGLHRLARQIPGVYVLDYDALVSRHGREQWGDPRKWLTARLPIAAGNLIQMAREWMRFLHPLTGKIAKVAA